ncbi:hypothetical protein PRVXH_002080 [Proteinivorax hydrogeniformans]|uniref:Membrane protein YesL n=1 Tax=Proteinivorax hydrogeniformans TaxID=1826727 RepID=A0AAU8HRE4_9FIRM
MKKLSVFSCVKRGLSLAIEQIGLLIGCVVLAFLASLITGGLYDIYIIGYVLSIVVSAIFEVGLINISLKAAKQEKARFEDLFAKIELIGSVILVNIMIFSVVVLLLFVTALLIDTANMASPFLSLIAGAAMLGITLYIIIGFVFATYIIVDKEEGPIGAITKSYKMMQGVRLKVFGLFIVVGLINILGLLAFVLGLLITIPAAFVILSVAYQTIFKLTFTENTSD